MIKFTIVRLFKSFKKGQINNFIFSNLLKDFETPQPSTLEHNSFASFPSINLNLPFVKQSFSDCVLPTAEDDEKHYKHIHSESVTGGFNRLFAKLSLI
jgi:hypothetical protein